MSAWVIWAIVAVAFAIGEVLTPGLFWLGPIALAGLLAAIVAAIGLGTGLQLVVFILASIASLGILRPEASGRRPACNRRRESASREPSSRPWRAPP